MAGNGDERNERSLERIEAKLETIDEEMHGMRRLLQALGDRALLQAQETVTLRAEMQQGFERADGKLEALRADMQQGFQRADGKTEALRADMQQGFQRLRSDLELGLARLRVDLGAARLDAMESSIAALTRRLEAIDRK